MTHYGTSPSSVCTAILTGLSVLQRRTHPSTGVVTGSVRTIKRLSNDRMDVEAVDGQVTSGLPALLVSYLGGPFDADNRDGQHFAQTMLFSILCAAGQYSSLTKRLDGTDTSPGVEELLDWATYYACRAAAAVSGINRVRPVRHTWLRIEPGRYVAAVELEAVRRLDTYDDELDTELTTLGLVGNPLDPDELWTDELETEPNIADPATQQGGVAEL